MHPQVTALLRKRLSQVEERLARACARASRSPDEVTLIAVTKTVSPDVAAAALDIGLLNLGENRPQELWRKAQALPNAHWHMIGHMQRNKIEKTLPLVTLVHSVDSARLLQALEEEAGRQGRKVAILLEVNASGEASKHGFSPIDLPTVVPLLTELRHVEVRGLMTMAALQQPEACRPTFTALRNLRNRLQKEVGAGHPLQYLSMGMSNDFEVAIEEGATHVRLGTVLFEGLQ